MSVAVLVAVAAVAVVVLWLYNRHRHSYWAAKGIQSPPATPFLGHMLKMFSYEPGRFPFDYEAYTKYGGSKFCGMYEFHKPVLFIGDVDLMKHVFIKDFDHFSDRRHFNFSKKDDVMSDMLSIKEGQEWKILRAIMSPVFTSGKIKSMFPVICKKADLLVSYSLKQAAENPFVDCKKNFGRFTMDVIASCAFGIETSAFNEEKPKFVEVAECFFSMDFKKSMNMMLVLMLPRLSNLLGISFSGEEMAFFTRVVEETIALRKKSDARGDFLDLLLEAQATDGGEDKRQVKKVLTDRCIVSQCVMFLVAGYDTTGSTISFCAYELAKNEREQQRLREELRRLVKENDGELTLQAIMDAKFLEACVNETLRKYPPLVTTERCCTKPYHVPGTNVDLRIGDMVQVPIWCLHHDPKHWPEPHRFSPDRFMPENKHNIHSFTFLPFGLGPRNCLAMRFALLEVKIALAKMVLATEMRLAEGQEELELCTGGGVIRPKHGIKMHLQPLSVPLVG